MGNWDQSSTERSSGLIVSTSWIVLIACLPAAAALVVVLALGKVQSRYSDGTTRHLPR